MSTKIEWADETWNPTVGCTRVSRGCDHCYAVRHTRRLAGQLPLYRGLVNPGKGHFNGTVRTVPERLEQPLRWRKPRRVFVDSMSDLFHPDVPDGFIAHVFAVMAASPQHTYQILTKRSGRMAEVLGSETFWAVAWEHGMERWWDMEALAYMDRLGPRFPLPGVWLGTSVEDQDAANERIPHLLRTPAAVRFLSCEPLLGPLRLSQYLQLDEENGASDFREFHGWGYDSYSGGFTGPNTHGDPTYAPEPGLHWVIVGGESGPRARPMHPDWARSLRDQCEHAGVPFFFKQWGAWVPPDHFEDHPEQVREIQKTHEWQKGRSYRVGKKAGGRELDGRIWDEFPEGGGWQ